MSSRGGTTLYVTGFGHGTRARDLAYEFERYGLPRFLLHPVLPSQPPIFVEGTLANRMQYMLA